MNDHFILFTDLDGTLLDHHTYQPGQSLGAVRRLTECGIPVVFCSSKTFAEQRTLQEAFRLRAPFIVENGSAIAVPDGFFSIKNYPVWRRVDGFEIMMLAHEEAAEARRLLQKFPDVVGFSQASDAALGAATALSGEALDRARDRWFTETLLQPNDPGAAEVPAQALAPAGWTLSKGGRFYTVQSREADKGRALRVLLDIFHENGLRGHAAAVGDSPNDAPMLAAATRAFLVQQPSGHWAEIEAPGLQRVKGAGPAGFSAVARLLCGF